MFEFSPDYTPAETGLDRFINFKKEDDFIGKKAVLEQKKNPPLRKLCAFEVDANEADVTSYEPIFKDDKVIGFCTSGGYSHHTKKSIAQGFIPTSLISKNLKVKIEILGELRSATILLDPIFDPENLKMTS
jgi:dimethylglycine dehydrogenase